MPQRLVDLSEDAVAHKPAPNRWSKKEILGHLIDSAANNHQRFVRAQGTPRLEFPSYEQEFWVSHAGLRHRTLARSGQPLAPAQSSPAARGEGDAGRGAVERMVIGGRPAVTLEALIADYLRHVDNHLAQLFA